MIKVKNNGKQPFHFGKILAYGGGNITAVSEEEFEIFCENKAGAYVFDKFFEVVDENYEKKQLAEKTAIEAKALIEAEKKLRPEIKKELRPEIEKKLRAELTLEFNNKYKNLEKQTIEKVEEKVEEDKDFIFDPAIHSVDHRGHGKYYAMDGEEIAYGPLTEDEKTKFDAIVEKKMKA